MGADSTTWSGQTLSHWQKFREWVGDRGDLLAALVVVALIVVAIMLWRESLVRERADRAQALAAAPVKAHQLLGQIGLAPDKEIVCVWSDAMQSFLVSQIDCTAVVQGRPVVVVCRDTCSLVVDK
jgi:hypothetical protein